MKNVTIALMLGFGFLISSAHAKKEGGCGSHGGDGYSLEFYRVGKFWASELKSWKPSELAELQAPATPALFEEAVENSRIVSTDRKLELVEKDGTIREVDAINHPHQDPPIIEVNRARIDQISKIRANYLGVVLHEYLGILKGMHPEHGEWDTYQVSARILEILDRKNRLELPIEHRRWVTSFVASYATSPGPDESKFGKGIAYACIEYSALADDTSRFTHQDAYVFSPAGRGYHNSGTRFASADVSTDARQMVRSWVDVDPTERKDHPGSVIKEFVRMNANLDLLVEVTSDYRYHNQPASISAPSRGVISYLYCPAIQSEAIQKIRFLRDSVFDVLRHPETPEFADYRNKLRDFTQSEPFLSYLRTRAPSDKERAKKIAGAIHNTAEIAAMARLRANADSINYWRGRLNYSDLERIGMVFPEYLNLYVRQQQKIRAILDTVRGSDIAEIRDFVDTLFNKVPPTYRQAALEFERDSDEFIRNWIEGFTLR